MEKQFTVERPVRMERSRLSSRFASREAESFWIEVDAENEDNLLAGLDESFYFASERPDEAALQKEIENTAAPNTGTAPSEVQQEQEHDSFMREELSVATDNHDLAATRNQEGKNILEPLHEEQVPEERIPSVGESGNQHSPAINQEAEEATLQAQDRIASTEASSAMEEATEQESQKEVPGLSLEEAAQPEVNEGALPEVDNASMILEINQEPLPGAEETTASAEELEAALAVRRETFQGQVATVRASVIQNIFSQKEQVSTHFSEQQAVVAAENESAQQTVRTTTDSAKAEVESTYTSVLSRLQVQLDLTLQNIDVKKEEKLSSLSEIIRSKKEEFSAYIDEKEAEPESFAEQEGQRIQTELTAAADLCIRQSTRVSNRYSTEEEKQAALAVGTESANDIRSKIEPMRQNVMELAQELRGNFGEYRDRVFIELDRTEEQLRPMIEANAEETKANLRESFTSLSDNLNRSKATDLSSLDQILEHSLAGLDGLKSATLANLERSKVQGMADLERMSALQLQAIDRIQQDTLASLGGSGTIYLPGVDALFADATGRLSQLEAEASGQVSEQGTTIRSGMTAAVQTHSEQCTVQQTRITEGTAGLTAAVTQRTEESYTAFTESATNELTSFETGVQEIIDNGMTEVETSINTIKETIEEQNTEAKEKIRERTTENIEMAKMPLLDDNETRSIEAAASLSDRSWWETGVVGAIAGVLFSILKLIVIFIVIVAVAALIVAALAAIGLTVGIWTVIAVIGIGLLLVMAYISYGRRTEEGHSGLALVLLVLADSIGFTDFYEGIFDNDIATGAELNQTAFERGDRTTTGFFTMVMTFLMVRGGVRSVRTRFSGAPAVPPPAPATAFGRGMLALTEGVSAIGRFAQRAGRGFREWATGRPRTGEVVPEEGANTGTEEEGTQRQREEAQQRQREEAEARAREEQRQREEEETRLREEQERQIQPGDEIIVDDPARIQATEPQPQGDQVDWNLYDTETGAVITEYVHASETLGPDMYLRPHDARLPGVGRVKLIARGFSWTVEAIRLNIEAYIRFFGRRPPNLNGQLAEGNMLNFQREYVNIRRANPTMSRQEIADAAILRISFGKHRVSAGYGRIRVTIEQTTTMEFDGIIEEGIPHWVEIEALPTEGGGGGIAE